ncbi:MAG: hypothetical protein R3C56_19060 [Pirellulaceae bacterium]
MNDATEHEPTLTVGDKIADAAATATLDDLDEQIEREAANKLLERAGRRARALLGKRPNQK